MKYTKNLISVIVPVYNVEKYLKRCLDSIINNSYKSIEIICIDDGSTDDSGSILDLYSLSDNRMIVVHKDNGGLSSSRNIGIEKATGEYITFIDSDDWIHPRFFEFLLKVQQKENADVVDSAFVRVDSSFQFNLDVSLSYKKIDCSMILKSGMCWRRLFRHDLVRDIRFRNFQIEDTIYNMEVLWEKPNLSMFLVDIPLFAYYQRDDSLSRKLTAESESAWMREYLRRCECTSNEKLSRLLLERVQKRALSLRYDALILHHRSDIQIYNRVLRESIRTSTKSQVKYIIFCYFPYIYRFFRILQDPSMLRYENKLRESESQHLII